MRTSLDMCNTDIFSQNMKVKPVKERSRIQNTEHGPVDPSWCLTKVILAKGPRSCHFWICYNFVGLYNQLGEPEKLPTLPKSILKVNPLQSPGVERIKKGRGALKRQWGQQGSFLVPEFTTLMKDVSWSRWQVAFLYFALWGHRKFLTRPNMGTVLLGIPPKLWEITFCSL